MTAVRTRGDLVPREAEARARLYSTNQLADAAGVTPRTVRFYESQGLLKPQRAGVMRVYTFRDKARLSLILRGKRLGFSLQEIGEYLDLYSADPNHVEQVNHILSKTRERIGGLESKLDDLQAALKELRAIEREALGRLKDNGIAPAKSAAPESRTGTRRVRIGTTPKGWDKKGVHQ